MSEWTPVVVRLPKRVGKHPNADNLSICHILGEYPVIFRTEDFGPGSLACYIPVDTLVPLDDPRFSFLDSKRVRARKLRGIFSMGLLVPPDPSWPEGMDVREALRLTKWEPAITAVTHGANENGPPCAPWPAYDLEALRKHPHVLIPGEPVIVTEKIHGTNARFCWDEDRLFVGSHHVWKEEPGLECREVNVWWQAARDYAMADRCKQLPRHVVYGEIYGWVQDLRYGAAPGQAWMRIFDIQQPDGRFLSWPAVELFAREMRLETVPVLYRGPWSVDLKAMAEGLTTLPMKQPHIREGIVIQADPTRYDHLGRVKLKHVGEQYHLRKEGVSPIMTPPALAPANSNEAPNAPSQQAAA